MTLLSIFNLKKQLFFSHPLGNDFVTYFQLSVLIFLDNFLFTDTTKVICPALTFSS